MIKTILRGNHMMIAASEGMKIIRKGAEPEPASMMPAAMTLLPGESPEDYEEIAVADLPLFSRQEYEAKAAELVRREYTEAQEFALQRKVIDAMVNPAAVAEVDEATGEPMVLTEFRAYSATVEGCKAEAKRLLEAEARARAEAERDGEGGGVMVK